MDELKRNLIIIFFVSFIVASIFLYIILTDLIFSLFAGAIIGSIIAGFISQIMPNPEIKEFANIMGLNYHIGFHRGRNFYIDLLGGSIDIGSLSGSMDGDYRDHEVRIFFIVGDEDSPDETNFEVKCRNLAKIDMKISRRGISSALMKKLGRKYIEIGVPEFDKHFTIRGRPGTDLMFILDDSIQQKIQSLRHLSYVKLHKNKITIRVCSRLSSKRSLKKFLDVLIDIAEKVEEKEPSTDIAREYDKKLGIYHPNSQNLKKTKFCLVCGTKNSKEALFCQQCGQEL